jgi:hypothetical protein
MALIYFQQAMPAFAGDTNLEQEVQELSKQNLELKAELEHQTDVLNSLSQKVNELEAANPAPETTYGATTDDAAVPTKGGFNFGNINLIPILTDYRNNESGRSVCLSAEPVMDQR